MKRRNKSWYRFVARNGGGTWVRVFRYWAAGAALNTLDMTLQTESNIVAVEPKCQNCAAGHRPGFLPPAHPASKLLRCRDAVEGGLRPRHCLVEDRAALFCRDFRPRVELSI